jgi:hypothetical protein
MAKTHRARTAMLPTAPLLITESKDEFDRIRGALHDEIKPHGIIEQMYVEDIAHLVWEILRLRRSKAAIINFAFCGALEKVVLQLVRRPGQSKYDFEKLDELALDWFSDPDVKAKVAGVLREFELDESAIEAEAIRTSTDDLERLDRLMASSEARRDRALVRVAQYRGDFGALLRESSNRVIESKVLSIESAASQHKKSAA